MNWKTLSRRSGIQILIALTLLIPTGLRSGRGADGPPAKTLSGPDHLVPLDPYNWASEYFRWYCNKLQLPTRPEAAVMVRLPSFDPEECLVIHESRDERPTYTLIYTRANQNIWYSMPHNSEDGKQKSVKVSRQEVSLPSELAGRVCRIWETMLRGVRYPSRDQDFEVMDGVRTEFWRHSMYGQTSPPLKGAPKLLNDLGRVLMRYCSVPEDRRPKVLEEVERKCRALEKYLGL